MIKDNNAAARLYKILDEARRTGGTDPLVNVWSKVFKLKHNDTRQVFHNLILLFALAEQVEKKIKKIPNLNHEIFLANMPSIKQGILYPNLQASFTILQSNFSESNLRDLLFCAERLTEHFGEERIAEEDLRAIKEDVNGLFEKVNSSNLNLDLKEVLLDLIETIRRGIAEYEIRGVDALRDAIEESVGKMAVRLKPLSEQLKGSHAKEILKSIWSFLGKMDIVITKAMKYPGLVGGLSKLLEDLSRNF